MGGKVSERIAIYEQYSMLDCASVEDVVSADGVGCEGGGGWRGSVITKFVNHCSV